MSLGKDFVNSFRITAATHAGVVRSSNEDYFVAGDLTSSCTDGLTSSTVAHGEMCLAVVSDGLGGHPCGEVASRLAAEFISRSNPAGPGELVQSFIGANEAIYRAMSGPFGAIEMGTTASAVLITGNGLTVVNVGDSPAFEFIDEQLVQLSRDHVPIGKPQLPGLPSSVVTQSLGGRSAFTEIYPHCYMDELGSERRVLLCSDGLTNFVPRDQIISTLRNTYGVEAVDALIGRALEAGGRDNVTVVLLEPLGHSQDVISEAGRM